MPFCSASTCSRETKLPCTTSTLYGVIALVMLRPAPSTELQPARTARVAATARTRCLWRGCMADMGGAGDMIGTLYRQHHGQHRRTQEHRTQGHAAAAEDPRGVP